jgi:hypothetical protein
MIITRKSLILFFSDNNGIEMKKAAIIILALVIISCSNDKQENPENTKSGDEVSMLNFVDDATKMSVISNLVKKHGEQHKTRIEKGVNQAASFWMEKDGSPAEFSAFCEENFIADDAGRQKAFETISDNFELFWGHFNKMSLMLQFPLHVETDPVSGLERSFGAYDPSAHLADDMFGNKIAFKIILNFPFYTLDEKNELGKSWTREEWAAARIGDIFSSRVPATVNQHAAKVSAVSSEYIDNYNIFMVQVIDNDGNKHFPENMKLITHWNLRDELKSNYAGDNQHKQDIIYDIMLRIIRQEIPEKIINSGDYEWNPSTNKTYKDGSEITLSPEPDTRYDILLQNFKAMKLIDEFNPNYPTYIERKFEKEMQMKEAEVEQLFVDFISSPLIKEAGELIKNRLGRELKPYDIWYDGFKPRSTISEEDLNKITRSKYPTPEKFADDLNGILTRLGFTGDKAQYVASKVAVDPSRGAGHAWGAQMRTEKAHLRTRVGDNGMDYKGYNIAIHEFGHNVEQTFSLYDMDYYMMQGVPNNAFTEAVAFIFQKRDLELLGISEKDPDAAHYKALDNLWSTYEIMGVALVDMRVWKWMYENHGCTAAELKQAVLKISAEVWNEYYEPVLGEKDSPLLAIYSHMISYPLYLSAYPIGHLIEFQVEEEIAGKDFGKEIERICKIGKTTPNIWMNEAVGSDLSVEPTLNAARTALEKLGK